MSAIAPHPGGRPRVHDREAIIADLCARVSQGELVKDVAVDLGIDRSTVYDWTHDSPELDRMYSRAREQQAHAIAEDILDISDGNDLEARQRLEAMVDAVAGVEDEDEKARLMNSLQMAAIQRDRLRADSRKWYCAKLAPKLYGDRQTVDLGVADSLSGLLAGLYRTGQAASALPAGGPVAVIGDGGAHIVAEQAGNGTRGADSTGVIPGDVDVNPLD